MTENTPLNERMKRYENVYRAVLPRRTYTLMRLDGRAFHTYLKNADKPFDLDFVKCMNVVAEALCREIQGAQFAYTQSDEISLLLTDFQSLQSEPWFGGNVSKMLSVSASLASVTLYALRRGDYAPQFDCRVWTMTDPVEVANYFIWRQRDAVRNSIQMLAQHYYSPRSLNGRSTNELQDILFREQNINWNDLDTGLKRGRVVEYRGHFPADPTGLSNLSSQDRENWQVVDAPHFSTSPKAYLATLIPQLPSLHREDDV
jgi:tRNA(His) 5'-end guanylyltransferase